jgi:hypothetical protein
MEKDKYGKDPHQPGAKLDLGKPKLYKGLMKQFPLACEQVAVVSEYGANKYTWNGWEQVDDGVERYMDALFRHIQKEDIEGFYDIGPSGSGLMHAAHVAWNALAVLELKIKEVAVMETVIDELNKGLSDKK